jgi:hypothetical protein
MKTLFLLFALVFSASALVAESPPQVQDFDQDVAEKLGRQIYEQDVISWVATDVLFAQELDLSQYPIRGWVVEEGEEGATVTFVGIEGSEEPFAIFEIRLEEVSEPIFRKREDRSLTESQLARFRARNLALDAIEKPCSERYNPVVLEHPTEDAFLVYALAATTDPDAVPVGGHYRFSISKDGKTLLRSERLSASCLTLDKTPEDMPPGASISALTMSHIVSERPLEVHVFLSLLHEMDFYVIAEKAVIWRISEGKMRRVVADSE